MRSALHPTLALSLVACGGSVAAEGTSAPDAATDASSADCPTSPPMFLTACQQEGLHCTYPAPSGCSRVYACESGNWQNLSPPCESDSGPWYETLPVDAITREHCPATLPSGACTSKGLDCEFSDDPRPYCRERASCNGSTWLVAAPACAMPPSSCPPEADAVAAKNCPTPYTFCLFSDRTCECGGSSPARWYCDSPAIASGCPVRLPRLGTSCTHEGLSCTYGSCGLDDSAGRTCGGGIWLDQPAPCGV